LFCFIYEFRSEHLSLFFFCFIRAELAELKSKLSARERDAELVRRADNRAKEAAKLCDKLRWDNEQVRRTLRKVEKERNELYEKFVKAIAEVREKNAQKTLILERKLASMNAAVESKETQLEEVLRASATPAVAASLAKKVEDVLETKNATINELRREVAELCVAHNDLLGGNADPKAAPVRPSFA
jgi:chromosome segregation ATPase